MSAFLNPLVCKKRMTSMRPTSLPDSVFLELQLKTYSYLPTEATPPNLFLKESFGKGASLLPP